MPKNYELLSTVQKSIRTFGEPDVVIEGHTDSTDPMKSTSIYRNSAPKPCGNIWWRIAHCPMIVLWR